MENLDTMLLVITIVLILSFVLLIDVWRDGAKTVNNTKEIADTLKEIENKLNGENR